jgi:protein-S-isoprenylcysteine O-methyltransferase Ste14
LNRRGNPSSKEGKTAPARPVGPAALGPPASATPTSSSRLSRVLISSRRFADLLLLGVTTTELVILFYLTPNFELADWIYVLQHVVVLGIALTRPAPLAQDRSVASAAAVVVAYSYSYAQVIYLNWAPGNPAWETAGLVLVSLAAVLSLASLLTLGRRFGIRPALRGVATEGPYRIVRHPMYLSYMIGDIGYNLEEWNAGAVVLVLVGWLSLLYRIHAEERILSQDPRWIQYAASVRYRLLPRIW